MLLPLHDHPWGFSGPCDGGPWDGFTLSDALPLARLSAGDYRFLDDRWRWCPKKPK